MESLSDIYSLFVYGVVVGGAVGCATWIVGYGIKSILNIMKRS